MSKVASFLHDSELQRGAHFLQQLSSPQRAPSFTQPGRGSVEETELEEPVSYLWKHRVFPSQAEVTTNKNLICSSAYEGHEKCSNRVMGCALLELLYD